MSLRRQIEDLKRQLVDRPNDVELVQQLGSLMEQTHDDLAASVVFFRLAQLHARDGKLWKAVAFARKSLRLCPAHPEAHEALAGWHAELERAGEAVAHYRLALADCRAVHDEEGIARITARLIALGAQPDGLPEIEQLRRRVAEHPDELSNVLRLGTLLRDAGDGVGAGAVYLQAAKLRVRGSRTAAVSLAKEAVLKLNPRLVEANELIADWSAELGRVGDAVKHYRVALRQHQASRDAEGVARVFAALEALGGTNGARA